jgi:hypothetical protein
MRERMTRGLRWLCGLGAALCFLVSVLRVQRMIGCHADGVSPPHVGTEISADQRLERARLAYQQGHAEDCVRELDEAASLVPPGEKRDDILRWRALAREGLEAPPATAPSQQEE